MYENSINAYANQTMGGNMLNAQSANCLVERKPLDAALSESSRTLDVTISILREALNRLRGPQPQSPEKPGPIDDSILGRARTAAQAADYVQGLANEIAELI